MADYRDYGFIGNDRTPALVDTDVKKQVFLATHDGGGNLLPYRYRSFISFTFGGKRIEDFDLIATLDNNGLQRSLSADFEDLTTSSEILNGQTYYGTYFKTNHLNFRLVSDAIDQLKLEEFRHWFAGGQTRELILSEHPNRAIMARVATPPEIEMIPFEKPITISVNGFSFESSTTVYRGFINLEFVMDDPFWYSKNSILGEVVNGQLVDKWEGVLLLSGTEDANKKLKDAIKIVYEDGIPLSSMLSDTMLFGNNVYAAAGTRANSIIIQIINESEYIAGTEGYYNNGISKGLESAYYRGAVIDGGVIAGPYISNSSDVNITLTSASGDVLNFYYPGTAPAPVQLSFTVPIQLDSNKYVNTFKNSYTNASTPYNVITVTSTSTTTLRLTTPNFLTSYNKLIYLLKNTTTNNWETLRSDIRDNIRHDKIRAWAIAEINTLDNSNASVNSSNKNSIINAMAAKINGGTLKVVFDSKDGKAIGTFTVPEANTSAFTENVGDMLESNFLILKDRNYFDSSSKSVTKWTSSKKTNSYKLTHDLSVTMEHISIQYQNLYY